MAFIVYYDDHNCIGCVPLAAIRSHIDYAPLTNPHSNEVSFMKRRFLFTLATLVLGLNISCTTSSKTQQETQTATQDAVSQTLDFSNRKPFKYTINTDLENLDYGMLSAYLKEFYGWDSVAYLSTYQDDTVQILVSVNTEAGKYSAHYDLDCDGDGKYEYTGLTTSQECTYKLNSGKHQIWVRGDVPGLNLCMFKEKDEQKDWNDNSYFTIISIDDWGDIPWKTMSGFAAGCLFIEKMPDTAPDLSKAENLSYMFASTRINHSLENWDVSNVTNMSGMFKDTESFNQPLGNWNVSKVTNMSEMFKFTKSFNQPLDKWDVSNVTNMSEMFADAESFNQPLDKWNVSKVTDMSEMFASAESFNQPLENWDVSKVTNMREMFASADTFNQPLENWDVSKVTNMREMFASADTFNQPLDKWDVSNVTDMFEMFKYASSFSYYPENWVVPTGWASYEMFTKTKLEELAREKPLKTEVRVAPLQPKDQIAEQKSETDAQTGDDGNLKPFKFTIRTDLPDNLEELLWKIALESQNLTGQNQLFGLELLDDKSIKLDTETVHIWVSINAKDGKYPVKYDLDCEGDGNYEYIGLTASQECTYQRNSGKHQIWVRGEYPALHLCSQKEQIDHSPFCVESIDDWGNKQWKSMASFAAGCLELKRLPNTAPDLSQVQDMSMMLAATKINQPLEHWNTSNIVDMHGMFASAVYFNHPLGKWNVSNVTNMSLLFFNSSFNHPLETWDVSKVTDMSGMFRSNRFFNQPLEKWNVSNVRNVTYMFASTEFFNQPLEKWNVSNVTDLNRMFYEAYAFNQPLENWNVANVTDMEGLFDYAKSFNQPLEKWNVSNVTNMKWLFGDAVAFNQPLEKWNVSNVTNMSCMFHGAESFNQPLEKWNVSNVTDMSAMFYNARAFNQPLEKWNVSNVTDMRAMFYDARVFNQPLEKWNVSNVTNMGTMFWGAASFNCPLGKWNISKVEKMEYMFAFAKNFDQSLDKWDISNVKDMHSMFSSASSFSHYPKNWVVRSYDLPEMFEGTKVEKLAKKKPLKTR